MKGIEFLESLSARVFLLLLFYSDTLGQLGVGILIYIAKSFQILDLYFIYFYLIVLFVNRPKFMI